jgi:hypothetical protein
MSAVSPEEAQARVRAVFGNVVSVTPVITPAVEPPDSDADIVDLLTRVCYFYPQYTLETVNHLTEAQVNALLIQAEKQRAIELYNHTLIAAAPHSKKGKLVEKLIKQYKKIAEL